MGDGIEETYGSIQQLAKEISEWKHAVLDEKIAALHVAALPDYHGSCYLTAQGWRSFADHKIVNHPPGPLQVSLPVTLSSLLPSGTAHYYQSPDLYVVGQGEGAFKAMQLKGAKSITWTDGVRIDLQDGGHIVYGVTAPAVLPPAIQPPLADAVVDQLAALHWGPLHQPNVPAGLAPTKGPSPAYIEQLEKFLGVESAPKEPTLLANSWPLKVKPKPNQLVDEYLATPKYAATPKYPTWKVGVKMPDEVVESVSKTDNLWAMDPHQLLGADVTFVGHPVPGTVFFHSGPGFKVTIGADPAWGGSLIGKTIQVVDVSKSVDPGNATYIRLTGADGFNVEYRHNPTAWGQKKPFNPRAEFARKNPNEPMPAGW